MRRSRRRRSRRSRRDQVGAFSQLSNCFQNKISLVHCRLISVAYTVKLLFSVEDPMGGVVRFENVDLL